jgi:O-antigen/teichoic acid export membrane protein
LSQRPPDGSIPPAAAVVTSGQRVAHNVLWGAAGQVWALVLLLVSVPIVVHGLGESAYGIYVLVSVLLGYVAFLDLGLTPAVVRSIAIHHASGDSARLSQIVGTALALLTGLGILGGALLWLLAPVIVNSVLQVPADLRDAARIVLEITAVGFAGNMVLTLFGAIPQGLQRLDLFTVRTIVLATATAVVQILAVKLGGGLVWVAGLTVAVNMASLLVFVIVARRLLPQVSFRPRFNRRAFSELSGFGLMRFLNQGSGQVVFQLDRVIVAAFLPIRAVTLYAVPLSIAQKFTTVQFIFSGAFFPAASELHGGQETDRLRRLYIASLKLSLVMVLPLVILVAAFARPLLTTWIGPDFGESSSQILVVLAIAYGLATLVGVPALASDATGHAHYTAGFALLSAAINLSLTVLLVPRLGPVGAAYALLINAASQGIVFVYVVQRWFVRVPLLLILRRAVVRPLLAGVVPAVYALLLAPYLGSFPAVIAATVIGAAIFALMTIVVGVWDERELQLARAVARQTGARLALRKSGRLA